MIEHISKATLNGVPWTGLTDVEMVVPKTCEHCKYSVIFENTKTKSQFYVCDLFKYRVNENYSCDLYEAPDIINVRHEI